MTRQSDSGTDLCGVSYRIFVTELYGAIRAEAFGEDIVSITFAPWRILTR